MSINDFAPELARDLASMDLHLRRAVELFDSGNFALPGTQGYINSMALQHSVQSGYTSAEVALLRTLDAIGVVRPSGAHWHVNLIRQFSSPVFHGTTPLLQADLANALQIVRGFRHIAMHVYDDFDIDRFEPVIPSIEIVRDSLPTAIEQFLTAHRSAK